MALKHKTIRCSVEAAVLSILIHLVLFVFAGSTVLLSVFIKDAVVFKGEKTDRLKIEKRAEVPVLLKNMQRNGPRPLMVKQVVRPMPNRITLPVPLPSETGFHKTSMTLHRESLSKISLPGKLDMGVSKINFFGTRSKGEKIIFIMDASKLMMEDAKGGYTTYKYAKDEIHRLVDSMPSATLINVLIYSGSNIDMFKPQVVPATPENRAALKEWLAPINSDPYNVGKVSRTYRPTVEYQSMLGARVRYWLLAVQAAMEQRADSIFVLCGAMGRYGLPSEVETEPPDPEEMEKYRTKRAAVDEKARNMLQKENEAREKKGLPPKIIYDWTRYVTEDLRLYYPQRPSGRLIGSYSPPTWTPEELVLDHLAAVCDVQYFPEKRKEPAVSFVYLIARDAATYGEYESIVALRKISREYHGDFKFLRGAKTMRNLTY